MEKQFDFEEWRPVVGYVGLYEVSSCGRVRRLETVIKHNKGGLRKWNGRMLKLVLRNKWYYFVSLCKDGIRRDLAVHKIVAEAFIPNPNNYQYIDHIDTDRTNNNVSNLRWCTNKMNQNNPITLVNKSKAQINNPNRSKKINQYTLDGILVKTWPSLMEIERELKVSRAGIAKCCNHKKNYKTAYGYKWEYVS